jgi:hypothetical protein
LFPRISIRGTFPFAKIIYTLYPGFELFACPTSHSGGRNSLAPFAVKKINRKGNTKFFARPTGIIRAGKDHKEI